MNARRVRGGILAAGALVLCAFLVGAVSAPTPDPSATPTPSRSQTTTYDIKPEEFSLMISPTRLVIGPSETGDPHTVTVVNRGQAPVHVDVQVQSFTGGSDGSLIFAKDAPYSAAPWLSIQPASFDVASGASQEVTATIVVPPDADLGDHQVALVFLAPAGETSDNIKINRGIATPVYITVPGPTDDSATVSELGAPGFSGGGPVTVTAKVRNTGTVHRDFRGDTALSILGADATDFPDFTVARGGDRDVSTQWQPPLFCICDLTVSIPNADSTSTSAVVRVVVFPVIPAALLLGLLALVAVLIVLVRRQRRRRGSPHPAESAASSIRSDV